MKMILMKVFLRKERLLCQGEDDPEWFWVRVMEVEKVVDEDEEDGRRG